MTLGIILCGITGRMGQAIVEQAKRDSHISIVAGVCRHATTIGQIPCKESLDEAIVLARQHHAEQPLAIIDFSSIELAVQHAELSVKHGVPIVLATTGIRQEQKDRIADLSTQGPVLLAPNTSLGATLEGVIGQLCTRAMPHADIHITDIHHKHKKDAPSGTALMLKNAIESVQESTQTPPQVTSIRAGEVFGVHTIQFFDGHESIEITHRVTSRSVFAAGALRAAEFIATQKSGLYTMRDVLGLG